MNERTLTGAPAPTTDADLDEYLSRPSAGTIEILARIPGDLLVLGAGGKMGLSLCSMARRALDAAGQSNRRVTAVSRFRDPEAIQQFAQHGIKTIAADLLASGSLDQLPDAPNVLYLVGMKFGSTDHLDTTWAMNAFLPGLVARRFPESRIVALSTGNVYPLTFVGRGGSKETDPPAPVGEYAQSCLGRERILAYYSAENSTPTTLIRLNYANALRYGVVTDIAGKVLDREPVDVTMGSVNVIWQGDANAAILASFSLCSTPPMILNVTGPETAGVRWIAGRLAELLKTDPPPFTGAEADNALLSNAARCHASFGYPAVALDQLLAWSATWIGGGGRLLHKSTGYQMRDGRF